MPEFKKKGHEKQYVFIQEVKDHVETASGLLAKVRLSDKREAATIKVVIEELVQGMRALVAGQMLIRISDRLDLRGQVHVVKANGLDELTSGDEDAKCLEKAEKVAGQKAEKKHRKLVGRTARSRVVQQGSHSSRDLGPPARIQ